MRVTTNSIGNYFPQLTKKVTNVSAKANVQKTSSNNSVEQILSQKEKEMFVKMYPQQKSEIMEYHYYQKNGVMSGVTVGSLFDRRG